MIRLDSDFEVVAGPYFVCVEAREFELICGSGTCRVLFRHKVQACIRVGYQDGHSYKLGMLHGYRCPRCRNVRYDLPIPFNSKEDAANAAMCIRDLLADGRPLRLRLCDLGVLDTATGAVTENAS